MARRTRDRARAAFIRLQIEAAKHPINSKKWNEWIDKADEFHKQHAVTWFAPLTPLTPKTFGSGAERLRTKRGLLAYLMVHTDGFLLKAHQPLIPDALAAAGVENLHFYSATKKIEAFASSPAFKWVSGFSYPEADDTALALFGGSDTMAHLRDIELTEVKVTDAGLEAFARDSRTTKLRTFGCTVAGTMKTLKGKYTAAGLLAILESKRFPRLCELDLDTEQPAKFDWAALLASPAQEVPQVHARREGSVRGGRNLPAFHRARISDRLQRLHHRRGHRSAPRVEGVEEADRAAVPRRELGPAAADARGASAL